LVHTEELKKIAVEAEKAEQENRLSDAMASWRRSLELLPLGSRQRQAIKEKTEDLGRRVDDLPPIRALLETSAVIQEPKSFFGKSGGRAGILGLLLLLLSKFKVLLLGFTKLQTLFSMLLFFGVYWNAFGWKFALGFVLSIYIHEMGHVVALNHYGIKATAPVFIPFIGAIIRVKQTLTNPREDSRVGLAGPFWGMGAALVAYGVYQLTGDMIWKAIAGVGAWINLFNLMPFWQLDGGRGFKSLTTWQRWIAILVIAAMWVFSQEGLLLALGVLALFQALRRDSPTEPDNVGLFQYAFLVVVLSTLCYMIPVDQNP
jgi:Zn-dependent protease